MVPIKEVTTIEKLHVLEVGERVIVGFNYIFVTDSKVREREVSLIDAVNVAIGVDLLMGVDVNTLRTINGCRRMCLQVGGVKRIKQLQLFDKGRVNLKYGAPREDREILVREQQIPHGVSDIRTI